MQSYVNEFGATVIHDGKPVDDEPETSSDLVKRPVAWLHKNNASGKSDLRFEDLADLPFNRERWTSIPLYDSPADPTSTTTIERLTAERDEDKAHIAKLQAALMFWMPGVSEAIEVELNGRAGDDAYLLAGYAGEFHATCWGDDILARAIAAEASLALKAEALKEAQHEVWNLGLAIGQIAKWPRTYFNRYYVEEWVIRTAKIIERWNGPKNAIDVLAVASDHTKPNKRLAAEIEAIRARSALPEARQPETTDD